MTTVDVREACCQDTLAAPIKKAVGALAPNEVLEVIITPSFRKLFGRLAQEERYAILEEREEEDGIHISIRVGQEPEAERKEENCMVCGGALEYLTTAVELICNYCGKKEGGYVRCPAGHYVCEECHRKGAYDMVKDIALSTHLRDPLAIAEIMMSHPSIPMLGCENAIIAAGALMAALRNRGSLGIEESQVLEAMNRTQRQALSAYCGLTGVCGVPIAVGAAFSVLLGAACPKDRETSMTMQAVARTVAAVANETGPCCCKSFVRTGMIVGSALAKEYLDVRLPIRIEKVSCSYMKRHPNGCRASKCSYFPKKLA